MNSWPVEAMLVGNRKGQGMTYSKIIRVGCPGCGEPVDIATDMLDQPIECGDCGTPIPVESYPELIQAKADLRKRAKVKRRADKERKREERDRERVEEQREREAQLARDGGDGIEDGPAAIAQAPEPQITPSSNRMVIEIDSGTAFSAGFWGAVGVFLFLLVASLIGGALTLMFWVLVLLGGLLGGRAIS